MPIARKWVAKRIHVKANARNNRSIANQRSSKQAVLSVGSVQSGYKRVEIRSWQFSSVQFSSVVKSVEGSAVEC
jgi:hypothetical protein